MHLLKYVHKTPFWSQFLVGIFAIFALPEIQVAENVNEQAIGQSFAQTYVQYTQNAEELENQSIFIAEQNHVVTKQELQAVIFHESFAKSYSFDDFYSHLIRAGPYT